MFEIFRLIEHATEYNAGYSVVSLCKLNGYVVVLVARINIKKDRDDSLIKIVKLSKPA